MSEIKVNSVVNSTGDNDSGFDLSTNDVIVVKTANTERMRVLADGKVGISTTSPAINLEVSGDMAVSDTTTATKRLQLSGGASEHTINSANYGSDMMDLNIQAENAIFKTGLIGVAERMRIASNGNVGIGTNSPDTTLDLEATGDCTLTITAGSTSHDSKIEFAHGTTVDGGIQFNHDGSFGSEFIDFRVGNNTNHMRIHGGGAISVGDAKAVIDSNATLNVDQKGGGFPIVCHRNGSGDGVQISFHNDNGQVGRINTNGSSTSYVTSSDYRIKENVIYDFDATTRLKQLKPCRFNFIGQKETIDGFIAHEVTSVPEAITGDKDAMQVETRYTQDDKETQGDNPSKKVGDAKTYSKTEIEPQGIDQSKLVPLLVKSLQEAFTRIDTLEAEVKALKG